MWFLGASLFANLVAFFGVNYFDQSRIAWFLLLAMIAAASAPFLEADTVDDSYVGPQSASLELAFSSNLRSGADLKDCALYTDRSA